MAGRPPSALSGGGFFALLFCLLWVYSWVSHRNVAQTRQGLMTQTSEVRAWILTTLSGMVDSPQELTVTVTPQTPLTTEFVVTCAPADAGKIIGKNGHNIRALRGLLLAIGRKAGCTYMIVLEKPADRTVEMLQSLSTQFFGHAFPTAANNPPLSVATHDRIVAARARNPRLRK